jgi:hypothetical protein
MLLELCRLPFEGAQELVLRFCPELRGEMQVIFGVRWWEGVNFGSSSTQYVGKFQQPRADGITVYVPEDGKLICNT